MLTLALPSRGRLAEPSESLCTAIGININYVPRKLVYEIHNYRIVFIHPKDSGKLIDAGVIDMAISAQDIQAEYPSSAIELLKLGFAPCQIVLAVKNNAEYSSAKDLKNQIVASSYPNLTKSWFSGQGISMTTVELHGALEMAPWIGFAKGIVDSYQTGISAKANDLHPISTLLNSQAVLVGQPDVMNRQSARDFVDLLSEGVSRYSKSD